MFVDVSTDGSAHVNVAGRHEQLGPADTATTRQAVTAYAAAIAAELRRPVRMKITDPDGRWLVAVHPGGTVTDLDDAPQKARRPRKQNVTVPRAPAREDVPSARAAVESPAPLISRPAQP